MLERNRMWERACSRMRCISQPIYQLTDRIREQARSHLLIVTSCFFQSENFLCRRRSISLIRFRL